MKIKRVVALLLIMVFVVFALASCGNKDIVGKTYEVTKVKVTLSNDAKADLEKAGIDVDAYIKNIENNYKGITFTFNKDMEGITYEIDGNKVEIMGEKFKFSIFGTLNGKIKVNDKYTIELTWKEKK